MASAGCDAKIIIWDFKERYKNIGSSEKLRRWGQHKSLRGHVEDV